MYKIIGADGREYGPISLEQLREWHTQGRVNMQTRVLVTGETNWKTIADLPDFLVPPAPAASPATPTTIRPLAAGPSASEVGPRTSGFAVAGLVLGILSLFSFCCCAGIPFNLLGLIFSIIGLVQVNNRPDLYSGKGMAIAGLITSALSLLLGIGGLALNWHEFVQELQNA
ncbi:MAG TPA: DUF4190 domain-containing protein [Verrucomicrobiae bacterium]|nr:DUF4190 domain-containing protein [Verrucomicrobiae bacterium]